MAKTRDGFPLDPWRYVDVPPHHVVSRETGEVRDFDETGFRRDLARAFVAGRGDEAWNGAIAAVAQALQRLEGRLDTLERAISAARTPGLNPAPLDRIEERVERIRGGMGEPPGWAELAGDERPGKDRTSRRAPGHGLSWALSSADSQLPPQILKEKRHGHLVVHRFTETLQTINGLAQP